MLTLGLV